MEQYDDYKIESLKSFDARAIIESLRKGAVPVKYVSFFSVGREKWLKIINEDLDNYILKGGSKVRFINGDYGDGKTHFMSLASQAALNKNFAVSFVVLTREIPLHKFEIVYQSIVKNIQTLNEGSGIRTILTNWVSRISAEKELDKLLNSDKDCNAEIKEKLTAINETLHNIENLNINFANALSALFYNLYLPLEENESKDGRKLKLETLYRWFEGEKVSKRELKPFNIFEYLDKSNSKIFLNSLNTFLRYSGQNGLILLFDELETVLAQSTTIRNASYENVRLLIDNSEKSGFLHVFFSIIPDTIASEKGFKSYDALWSRVRSVGEDKRLNFRSLLIELHRTPLKTAEMFELGLKLRQIYEIAYRWDARETVPDELIKNICETQKRMGLLTEIRLFVKQIVRCLDMAEQGEPLDEQADMSKYLNISQNEMEQEKVENLQPKWDS